MPRRGDDREIGHCKLHDHCGLCGFTFYPIDHVAALILVSSETNGNTIYKALDASLIPVGLGHLFGGTYFCRGFCQHCLRLPETATVHVDCYNLYLRLATLPERLARLYRVATSKLPWREYAARPLETPRNVQSIISKAAGFLCFDSLEHLPYEIKAEICKYLGTGVLERLDVVQRIIHDMPAGTGEWLSVPVAHVQYWQRGATPVVQMRNAMISPRRLVIDSQGIRIIESSEAPSRSSRPGTELFVVASPADSKCEFRYGICRLVGFGAKPCVWKEKPRVWNMPNPPRLEDCNSNFSSDRIPDYLGAIDLSVCFGITFFNEYNRTIRIHAHTRSQPTAEQTFRQMGQIVRYSMSWIYVPLSPADTPTAYEVTSYCDVDGRTRYGLVNHCFRTSLAGDFTVGPWYEHNKATVYNISRRSTLIHDLVDPRDCYRPYQLSRIYPQSAECADFSPAAPHSPPPIKKACFSSARLGSIRRAWIYRCEERHVCKGLIIDYMSGGTAGSRELRRWCGSHRVLRRFSPHLLFSRHCISWQANLPMCRNQGQSQD
ncbi:hypothetical protein B0T11DRAFT_104910 [Plectosphaerella cucumerina]|uniref:Uncharacterized protein n=1 Tax=Plectosphaerella cucumerina TaxID=40658 RepID=A0A8K0TCP2_9PEZI|nr:hypothetical protein B0T11DRAFT_104910 [Plectosphaerella cucumerina]